FSPIPFGRLTANGSRPSAFFSACLSQPTGFQSAVALTSTAMSGVFSTSAPGLPAPVEVAHGQPCARRYSATSAWVFMPRRFLCWLIVVTFPDDAGLHVPTDGCDNVPCRLVLRLIAWRVPIGSHPCALDCLHLHEDPALDCVRVAVCQDGSCPFVLPLAGHNLVSHDSLEWLLVGDQDRVGRGGRFYELVRALWAEPQAEPFVSPVLELLQEGVGMRCAEAD